MSTNGIHSIEEKRIEKKSIDNNIPAFEGKPSTASAKANDIIALKDEELQTSGKRAKASKHKYGEYQNVLLKDEELQEIKEKYENWEELITYLDEYIEMKGYKAKSHYLCIKRWVVDAVTKQTKINSKNTTNNDNLDEWLKEREAQR